jgi:quercetin dioxygenase-like cupin family protein
MATRAEKSTALENEERIVIISYEARPRIEGALLSLGRPAVARSSGHGPEPNESGDLINMEPKSWDNIKEKRVTADITRKAIWGQRIMVVRWELAPNTIVPVHDHISEQVTIVESGRVTLSFPGVKDVTVHEGEILFVPSSQPHAAMAGPEGCTVIDLFSPIREDLIERSPVDSHAQNETETEAQAPTERQKYERLQGYLAAGGIEIPLEQLEEVSLDILARYVYEKECITMGQLRAVLGLDKNQAKELLRQWKHGDDHSEHSLKRKLERLVVFPWEQ